MANEFVGQGIATAQAGLRAEGRADRALGQRDTALGLQGRGLGLQERQVDLQEEKFETTTKEKVEQANRNAFEKMVNMIAVLRKMGGDDISKLLPVLEKKLASHAKALGRSSERTELEILNITRQIDIAEAKQGFTLGQGQTRFNPAGEEIASVDPKALPAPGIATVQLPDGTVTQVPENQIPAGATQVTLSAGQGIQDGQVQSLTDDPVKSIGAVIAPIIAKIAAGEEITKGERKALAEAKATGLLGQVAAGQGLSTAELLAGEGDDLTPEEQTTVDQLKQENITQEQFDELVKNTTGSKDRLERIAKALGFELNAK